jgi:cytochrome c oxidase subunit 2
MFKLVPNLVRWSRLAAALAVLLMFAGCDFNFWRMDGHQSTMVTAGPVAKEQWDIFMVTVWVTLVIFILVGAALAYATFKFRARTEADEHADAPAQSHGNPLIELGLIGASVLALVIIAVPTLKGIWSTYDVPEAEKANVFEVTATGYQWWFKFQYPNEQSQTLDAAGNASPAGPLITGNELVIPAGRPIRVHLRTVDVIHSFWVPKLAGKVDMIGNRANHLWFKADKPGYFWGQCAEYCGDSHAVMRFRVIALAPREFNDWLDQQMAPARNLAPATADANRPKAQFVALRTFKQNEAGVTEKFDIDPLQAWTAKQAPEKDEDPALVAEGKKLFAAKACSQCHTVRGHAIDGAAFTGVAGPDLTHIGSRTTIAGGLLENNREQMHRWIHDPGAVKPGNKMWKDGYVAKKITLTTADEVALVAYLESLK